jgi:2-polyprenyl-3-methyl-5-hydroxy-6-metoxy-1,4-benzoquinol methylase
MKNIISRLFSNTKKSSGAEYVPDEVTYYRKLFVEDTTWNSPDPNKDELSRWKEIKRMIECIEQENKKMSIIDVGCGRGWLSNKLVTYGEVIGIEPVAAVVEYAKSLFRKPEFFALRPDEFIQNKPNVKFDLVVCSEVLEHVIDKKKFIEDLGKLSLPGGHLIITTPRAELREVWEEKYGKPPQPIEEWISTDDLIKLLSVSGFKIRASSTAFSENIYQIHLATKLT